MGELESTVCVPCRRGEPPLADEQVAEMAGAIPGWSAIEVDGVKRLERVFKFKDFLQAMESTRQIGEMAEVQGHHPALLTEWGRVTVTWWTHKIRGLHKNDFIMCARTSRLYDAFRQPG